MGRPKAARGLEDTLARAQTFAEKLLVENARLRQMLAAAHVGSPPDRTADTARIAELERELAEARERLAAPAPLPPPPDANAEDVQQAQAQLADARRRYAELEEQNNNLANLYVASYQLHSTLDFREVIAIVMEIVINLVGAEAFSILLIDGKSGDLEVVAAEGQDGSQPPRLAAGEGVPGAVAKSGEAHYRPEGTERPADLRDPLAAIPLKIKDHVIGVIAVTRLFPQKEKFSPVDFELFNLLAGHAATAIFSAKLYSESERKLITIQSFLDLLTTT